MANDHAPQMSNQEYFHCLDEAATASRADDVHRIRTEVIQRWKGDPRADELADALYAHQERLAARENTLRVEGGRLARRLEVSRAESPIAGRHSLRS